jgi:hypothetical protein
MLYSPDYSFEMANFEMEKGFANLGLALFLQYKPRSRATVPLNPQVYLIFSLYVLLNGQIFNFLMEINSIDVKEKETVFFLIKSTLVD